MSIVKCPHGDGSCTIPGSTALITADSIRFLTREAVLAEFTEPEAAQQSLSRVDAAHTAVVDVLDRRGHPESHVVHAALHRAFGRTPGERSVVVVCSPCGHTYVMDL